MTWSFGSSAANPTNCDENNARPEDEAGESEQREKMSTPTGKFGSRLAAKNTFASAMNISV
jgi:hypothetical protein